VPEPAAASHPPLDAPASAALRSTAAAAALDADALSLLARRLQTTLIIYWLNDRGSYVWVVSPEGSVHSAPLMVRRASIDALVRTATTSWPAVIVRGASSSGGTGSGGADAKAALRRLYAVLIGPIDSWLPRSTGARITIVPHGSLFQLSFAALIDHRGKYLIERYATGYAPGGAALADALTPRADRGTSAGALLVADPSRPQSADGSVLPQLAGARAEVRLVDQTLAGRDSDVVLVGESATEPAVRVAAPHARLIHFAAHAFSGEGADRDPYIALASPRGAHPDPSADGRLTASEIYGLPLSADLVVLSACRSARGKLSSDGIADLSRAFIAAGAPSVVASLWDAADEPTSRLMRQFYRGYVAGEPKDAALRGAQLALLRALRAGEVRASAHHASVTIPEHPMFWAGFVLVGKP
jgi:CHAT domain-containing protein